MYPCDGLIHFQIIACLSTRPDHTLFPDSDAVGGNREPAARVIIGEPSVGETSTFKAKPPVGTEPIGASSEGASLYELIREDIIEGRLAANERLVAADLAERYGTSTNPVREALQLLRGEGFVVFLTGLHDIPDELYAAAALDGGRSSVRATTPARGVPPRGGRG